ncbi:MAG: DUF1801 domain-containing protein [Gammaproteobacteria bacterium]|jgi:hypothetical protein|nr:DUF1801 domain-containing protein [Gammaproteobacteria bacterium]
MIQLFRLSGASEYDLAIDEWLSQGPTELFSLAAEWFTRMREAGDDVSELMHDGFPTACVSDAAFAYVNVFTAHVNVGFFLGAILPDPNGLLEGTGKHMRHVKLRPGVEINTAALLDLIDQAYKAVKSNL